MNLKNLEKAKKTVGKKSTLKGIHNGKVKEVLLSSNCPQEMEKEVKSAASTYEIPVKKTDVDSKKLGVLCKETFNISVLGLLKGK